MTRGCRMATGSRLAEVLLELDMSQTELSRRSGVARETIWKFCHGWTTSRAPLILALAWALDLDPIALVDLYHGDPHAWPDGPRSGEPGPLDPGLKDWVLELRRGRDPFVCQEASR